MEFSVRELSRGIELNDGHTDENSLGKLMMDYPDQYTSALIYLWGQDSNVFPITTLTEGQVGGIKEVKSILYEWPTAGRARNSDEIASFDSTANPAPGYAGSPFFVNFRTNLIIEQYGLIAPDGSMYRVMQKGTKNSDGSWKYMLQPKNPTIQCATTNLVPGKFWVMTAPTIPEAYSRGNRDNKRGTGKMYNQIGFQRYSMEIGGNIANKVVNVEFPTTGGGKTNLWINEQQRQFEHKVLRFSEEHQWTSVFNRQTNGEIIMKDLDNGEPIPEGAGVIEMIKEVNYISYGESLPLTTINRALEVGAEKDTDFGAVELVLYGGKGLIEDFNDGITANVNTSGFQQALGEKMISGEQGKLSYGNTFVQYRNPTGDTITIKHLNMLDYGLLAENDKLNGNLHPRSGRPMSSHTGFFLDQSMYGGQRNVGMAMQKGMGDIYGILKGLAPIPSSWGSMADSKAISTDVDASSYTRKLSKGVNILNTTNCIMIQSVI